MSKATPISMLEFGERIDLCLCYGGGGGGGEGGARGRRQKLRFSFRAAIYFTLRTTNEKHAKKNQPFIILIEKSNKKIL